MSVRVTIVRWVQDQDLRLISQRNDRLEDLIRRYNIRNGQGVMFTNKAMNRVRIAAKMGSLGVVVLPPTAPSSGALAALFVNTIEELQESWISNAQVADDVQKLLD